MMTRAWLILADILVVLLLVGSLILLYLYPYPPVSKDSQPQPQDKTVMVYPLPQIEYNASLLTLEDLIRMAQELQHENYCTQDRFLTQTLEEAMEEKGVHLGDAVMLRIFKKEALLEVWMRSDEGYKHVKDYAICAYSGGLGPKLAEGDGQSPEGFYTIRKKQLNPNSKFHLAFNLGYPNKYDREQGRTGSFLMVHGNCVSIGCYAMTDEKIEEIYALVESALERGQAQVWVHIFPFRMTEQNMAHYANNPWYGFWENLKEGYDYFEVESLPPSVHVENKKYIIVESNETEESDVISAI